MSFLKHITYFLVFIFLHYACKHSEDPHNADLIKKINASDKFRKDIGTSVNTNFITRTESSLRLHSLQNGFDSIEIRVHYYDFLDVSRLFILSLDKDEWQFEVRELEFHNGPSTLLGEFDSVSGRKIKVRPKSGTGRFIDKLFKLHLFSMRDITLFPGYTEEESSTDGVAITIEIATRKMYKCYYYDDPEDYFFSYWQARNALMLIKFLKDEFNFRDKWLEGIGEEYGKDTINIKRPQ
jgi:hypothetical protein